MGNERVGNARVNRRREAMGEGREVMCAAAARRERERNETKGDKKRAKCARREERKAREGRRQRGGERRAPRRHGEELCVTAAKNEKERVGNGRANNLLQLERRIWK